MGQIECDEDPLAIIMSLIEKGVILNITHKVDNKSHSEQNNINT